MTSEAKQRKAIRRKELAAIRRSMTPPRPPRMNEDAFAIITEESAYWVGVLMADGCITAGRDRKGKLRPLRSLYLCLAEEDAGHVAEFAKFLRCDRQPGIYTPRSGSRQKQRQARISATSQKIVDDLARFGVVPRKTKTAKVIGLEYNRHFWRGLVDGDGSIFRNKEGAPALSVCGTKALMEQYSDFVFSVLGRKYPLRPMKSIWSVVIGGTWGTRMIRELYENCAVALTRKKLRAESAMQHQTKRLMSTSYWPTLFD
jgi:hypothetical protein